ncbi:hypothetical protein FOL46_007105 [Perkinsus olseni]|uniref:Peptidase A1 domain-containing protein n=1 Tax=Perkinsus olseni TaxID=32597 RepID=A0A7J6MQ19_PEROL|nr:hypothetical protein FOL46_007105 [Perkinsus olseni]
MVNAALKGTVTHNLPPEAMGGRRASADGCLRPKSQCENQSGVNAPKSNTSYSVESSAQRLIEGSGMINSAAFDGSFGGSQVIQDNGDSFLTVLVKVGEKVIKVIPDSGSFDLYLIDQGSCSKGLGLCRLAYNSKESDTHKCPDGDVIKDVVFGSGTARCRLGFDKAELVNNDEISLKNDVKELEHPASLIRKGPPKVLFPLWQIFALDEGLLRIWGDGKGFQGILGMGYKAGEDVSPDEALKQLNATEGVSAVTGISTLAPGEGASELFTDKFAICLPRGSRAKKLVLPEMASRLRSTPKALSLSASDRTGAAGPKFEDTLGNGDDTGMLWWGASIPRSRKFAINTPVIGVRHWTIGVKSVQVVDSSSKGNPVLTSFCDGKSPCAALVDSGTSLFALPVPRVKEIFRSLGDLKLDCSNVQDLPDIQIAVGDSEHPLVITPESYVMKVQAHDLPLYEALGQSLMMAGDLQQVKRTANPNVTLCLPAFMASPVSKGTVKDMPSYVQTGDHLTEMMILGIPIFREYTVMFDRQSSVIAFDRNPDDSVSCSSTTPPTSLLHQGRTTRNGGRPLTIRDMPPPESLVFPSGLDSLHMMTPPSSGAVVGSERIL